MYVPSLFCACAIHVSLHHCTTSLPQDPAVVRKLAERLPDIGRKMEYLLNTGAYEECTVYLAVSLHCTCRFELHTLSYIHCVS
jgi:hypothetical protein